jgi:hypothetical protein
MTKVCAGVRSRLRPGRAAALLCLVLLPTLTAETGEAQSHVRINIAEENLRAEPNGARVAVVNRDMRFAAGESRGQWRAITVEVWVPARSVIVNRRDGFNLVVAGGGAAIHGAPGSEPTGRFMGGVQLEELGRQGAWVRVRRPAWIWSPSVAAAAPPQTARVASPATGAASPPEASGEAPAPEEAPRVAPRTVHGSPDGDTIASISPATRLEVVGREGEWARVRLEGWVRVGAAGDLEQPGPQRDVSLRALRASPERYRGATLQWQVQFVALQRADSIRTDFERGEQYVLARDPGGEPGFVYIAVQPDQVASIRRIAPLERIEIIARVRTGRSPLTGHPVLELMELRR